MLLAHLLLVNAFAAVPAMIPSEAPSFVVPGTTMTYTVDMNGNTKTMVVTLKQVTGDLVFDWSMGEGMEGSRTITEADRASARAQDNYFANGETGAHPGTSTVFLSSVQMDDIAKSGKTAATIDGREVVLKYKGTESMDIATGESSGIFYVWKLVGKGVSINVFGNPMFPAIMEQDVGFHVKIDRIN